jgi:hypothetical protein
MPFSGIPFGILAHFDTLAAGVAPGLGFANAA